MDEGVMKGEWGMNMNLDWLLTRTASRLNLDPPAATIGFLRVSP